MGITERRRRVACVARTGTAVLLAVTLSGCWWQQIGSNGGQTRNNPLENRLTSANVDRLTLQWSTSAPGRLSEPVTDAGRAYVTHSVSGASAVRAYELATGSLTWERALPNTGQKFEVTPPVVFSGEDLLVGHPARPNSGTTPCADLRRMDPSSGDTIALRTTRMVTSATVTSSSIVAHMDAGNCDPDFLGNHRLVVRDQATLEILWTAPLDTLSNVAPTIADGRIYVNQVGTVLAYDAAGCGAATCSPLASVPIAVGVVQHMVVSAGRVLVVGWESVGSQTLAAFGVP